jgi:hypothetical protein
MMPTPMRAIAMAFEDAPLDFAINEGPQLLVLDFACLLEHLTVFHHKVHLFQRFNVA